jgi:hypothetical protein
MTTPSRRTIRSWPASLIAIASLGIACDAMGEQQPAAQEPVTAVLKMRESDFIYRSQLYYMSCDDLRNGVAVILRALGARDDVQVRVSNCTMGGVPDLVLSGGGVPQSQSQSGSTWDNNWDRSSRQQSPMERMRNETPQQSTPIHIWAMMPVPADSKVMKEMEQDKSRRELISRVTGNMNVAMNDPILFAATRQQVTLSRDTIKLGPEHCQLLDQMITHVFRDFDLKAVRKNLSCDPHQKSNLPPSVTVDALLPVGYVLPGSDKHKKKEKDPVPPPPEQQEQPAQPEQQTQSAPQEPSAQPQAPSQ